MQGFVQGTDRQQTTLFPECLDDWVGESNSIRAVDVFVDALELRDLGFDGVDPAATGVKRLAAIEKALLASPDRQISLTDPDCRSMATSGRGSGMVAHNVRSAVDTTNHLIVAHEVTNVGTDRSQLATIAQGAKAALRTDHLAAVA